VNAGPAAILGNGSLLATLSACGDVERLFWPSIDRGSHVGELRFGVELDGATEQAYLHDANVLLTRNGDVEVVDLVHELEPVLLRRIRGGGPLTVHCRPQLDGSKGGLASSVDGQRVVFYRRDVALAISAAGAEAFATGLGAAEGGLSVPSDGDAVVALAFGASSREAVARLDAALQQDFDSLVSARVRHDADRLSRAEVSQNGAVGQLYRRSLLALELLSDRGSGSVIAAPELDPDLVNS
jgi:glucoamylase